MVHRARGGTMMGNKYFIPIRGVIKGNGTPPPAVGSDARGMGRSGPSIHEIRNDSIPAIKTRERPFLPLYAFDFLELSDFQTHKSSNPQASKFPSRQLRHSFRYGIQKLFFRFCNRFVIRRSKLEPFLVFAAFTSSVRAVQ